MPKQATRKECPECRARLRPVYDAGAIIRWICCLCDYQTGLPAGTHWDPEPGYHDFPPRAALPPCGVPAPKKPYMARLPAHPTHESVPGYWQRHEDALNHPRGVELPIAYMLGAWLLYADIHRERYRSGIGEDGVLGLEWAKIGAAIRGLLNGDCGRIDCGAVDAVICDTLKDEGIDPDA